MHRIRTIIASAAAVSAVVVAGAGPALASPAHRQAPAPPKTWYLSLGDSLAQGVQPNSQGQDVITNQGYPDQLFQALHVGNPTLNLKKLGCPGDTTASMISGTGSICKYKGAASQLAAALAFLKAHQGHIQLVTIDIGANDLNPCIAKSVLANVVKCLEKTIPKVVKNLGAIMTALRNAPGGKTLPIIGMTYYDPQLAGWLVPKLRTRAEASIALASQFGLDLRKVYKAFGAPVASEFGAFHTSDIKHMVTVPAFGKVPRDVAYLCSYTWQCTAFQDEHANELGYGVIANSFLNVILGG